MKEIGFIESQSFDPYRNLALEELLARNITLGVAVMYLWQNADTVVIGKHQNAFSECNYALMREDGVLLARRKTGGGAVFHDDKNLNFTFINARGEYSLQRNLGIIKRAMSFFGLDCEISGRNDISYAGRKFSGNAFFNGANYSLHHGTIMSDVDLNRLERYLKVDPSKLLRKGVASVRARVINLKSVAPDMTIDGLKAALFRAFKEEYGIEPRLLSQKDYDTGLDELIKEYSSDGFIFGRHPIILSRTRKDYGELMLASDSDGLTLFSDCLDVIIIDYARRLLGAGERVLAYPEGADDAQRGIIDDINDLIKESS